MVWKIYQLGDVSDFFAFLMTDELLQLFICILLSTLA